jgi:hypothetical protein
MESAPLESSGAWPDFANDSFATNPDSGAVKRWTTAREALSSLPASRGYQLIASRTMKSKPRIAAPERRHAPAAQTQVP